MAFSYKNTPEGTRLVVAAVSKEVLAPYQKDDGTDVAAAINVTLRVLEGPHTGEDLFWRGGLKEGKNQEITMETLRNLGCTSNDPFSDDGLGSTKVHAVAEHNEYQGKTSLQWKLYPIKSKRAVLSPNDAKDFIRQFKALASTVAPVEVTDANRAGAIPPPKVSGGDMSPDGP